jgi:hypothetical protein
LPSTSSPPTGPAGSLAPRDAVKRHLLKLIISVVVLDAIAIPTFYIFHFDRDVGTRQQTFIGIWVLVSALVVAVQLRKIRRARLEMIRSSVGRANDRQGPTAPGA